MEKTPATKLFSPPPMQRRRRRWRHGNRSEVPETFTTSAVAGRSEDGRLRCAICFIKVSVSLSGGGTDGRGTRPFGTHSCTPKVCNELLFSVALSLAAAAFGAGWGAGIAQFSC